ncbi:MAG TPA: response regulator [Dongiaceae bacterium]|nr:response regulator [Dongiaceae bacterium]
MTKVLLVEDDAWLAELEAAILTDAGYDVTLTPHGFAAIEQVDKTLPDVIILDVLLTGTTAFTLLHELQSYSDTNTIPVILCTNMADQFDLPRLKPYGVRRLIDKMTMHPDDLVAAVRAVNDGVKASKS